MKKNLLSLVICISFCACQKEISTEDRNTVTDNDQGPNRDCIERIHTPAGEMRMNPADSIFLDNLLQKNGINKGDNKYYKYLHDTDFQVTYPPYVFDSKIVGVMVYTNSQRILTKTIVYAFLNDSLVSYSGTPPTNVLLDTIPHLGLSKLRQLFRDDIIKFDRNRDKGYEDSCFIAEFGYYEAGVNHFIKAWQLNVRFPKPAARPPQAYYDDNGDLLNFWDGVYNYHH